MAANIEDITGAMATTTLTNAEPSSAAASDGRRLYIGNVAYHATPEQVKDFFTGYSTENVIIPVNPRTHRPVGYAFVELNSAQEAEKAMSELSGQEFLSRTVSLQLARKPEGFAGGRNTAGGNEGTGDESTGVRKEGAFRGRGGRGRGRGNRTRGQGRPVNEDGIAPTNMPGQVIPLTESTNAGLNGEITEGTTTADGVKQSQPRGPRPQRQRGPPEDGIPSKTKVMVANLPFDYSEEKLKELFTGYQPVSAKIALRPIPRFMVKKLMDRNEPRKGRGFGFVTLETEEMQQKAVAEMNGRSIQEREIVVKVAIDSPGKEDAAVNDPEGAMKENGSNGVAETAAPVTS